MERERERDRIRAVKSAEGKTKVCGVQTRNCTHTQTHTLTRTHTHQCLSDAVYTPISLRPSTHAHANAHAQAHARAHHPWPGAIGARALRSLALVMPPYPSLPSDNVPEPKSYNFSLSLSLVPSAHTTAVSIVEKGAISKKSISRLTLLLKL